MLPLTIDPMPIPNQVINLVNNRPPITPAGAGFEVKNDQWVSSSFQTGNASNSYILSSVTLRFGQFTSGSLFVKLYSGSGSPNTEIMNFNVPPIGSTNNYEFTLTSPQLLTANTTYWLVAGVSNGSGRYFWAKTDSTVETGLPGWSIGNQAIFMTDIPANVWNAFPGSGPFQFSVNGQNYSPIAGDPYFSNVVLLLKGNGENNSTNIIDSSSNPKSITVIGNTRISTDQSRFDNSSIVFNGGGDRLSVSNNDFAFGSGDFTIEAWVRPTGLGVAFARLIQCGNFGSGGGDWQLVRDASGGTTFGYWFDIDGGSTRLISSVTVDSNAWHFIAIVRENSTVKMAIDGTVVATGTSSQNLTRTTITIGANEGGGESNPMFLDELRITKGVAREITLPTNPFPNL